MRLPLVLVALLAGSAHADGDSLVDMLGPREIAVGEAMRGGATGESAIPLNPSGLPLSRDVVFEGGYGYRMSDDASLIGLSACDSTAAMPGCFYYDYAGASPMNVRSTTHIAGTALAYPITPRVFLGAGLKYFHESATDTTTTSGFNWDIGTTVRLTDLVSVGVTAYNLWGAQSPDFLRAVGGGMLAHPIPTLAISFDARWKLDGTDHAARYGGGAELFLRNASGQTGFPIRAGALRDGSGMGTTYVSGGLGLATIKYGIDVALRHSVAGPSDTLFIASMRFFGPRMRAPSTDAFDE